MVRLLIVTSMQNDNNLVCGYKKRKSGVAVKILKMTAGYKMKSITINSIVENIRRQNSERVMSIWHKPGIDQALCYYS